MTRIITICFLSLLTLFCSCNKSDNLPDIVPTIDDEFTLSLWEDLNIDNNNLTFQFETIEMQECLNSEIISSVDIENQKVLVQLNGINTPEDCEVGSSPANTAVDLGNLAAGSYDVEIVILDLIVNQGMVEVSEDLFKLDLETNDGIQVLNTEIRRIPEHTFWGYIAVDDTSLEEVAIGFLTQLTILADQSVFAGGEYGHFKLSADASEIDMPVETNFPDAHKFIFKYSGDLENIKKLLSDFRDEPTFGSRLEIKMMSYQGEDL